MHLEAADYFTKIKPFVFFYIKTVYSKQTKGPRWPWISHLNFERTIANFFAVSEKNSIKEVSYVPIMHITALYIDGLKFREQFLMRVTQTRGP